MKKKVAGIYKITNNINGKFYIGRSINIKRRFSEHKAPSSWYGQYKNKPLYRAFKKYGIENFKFTIIKICEIPEETITGETKIIELLKPEYNLMTVNKGIIKHSEESKRKMSKSALGRKNSKESTEKQCKTKQMIFLKVKEEREKKEREMFLGKLNR